VELKCIRVSSDASSSISVTSVPTDVTGEGPTTSLGLIRWLFIVEDRAAAEEGRRELDSTELADDLNNHGQKKQKQRIDSVLLTSDGIADI
jgi:hypothetical protein